MLFEESVFIFQFLNNKMHNYVLFAIIVHFNIQKLKNKQTFIQTEKAKSSHFDRTRGDKKQIFPTYINSGSAGTAYLGESIFVLRLRWNFEIFSFYL